jgi:hypothetical protein
MFFERERVREVFKNIFSSLRKGFWDRRTELPVLFGWHKKLHTRNKQLCEALSVWYITLAFY